MKYCIVQLLIFNYIALVIAVKKLPNSFEFAQTRLLLFIDLIIQNCNNWSKNSVDSQELNFGLNQH